MNNFSPLLVDAGSPDTKEAAHMMLTISNDTINSFLIALFSPF
jgi:hypothetical protein